MTRKANSITVTSSPEETFQWGVAFGKSLPSKAIIALNGDLGAGKTTLAKGIISGILNISSEEIVSPTFTYLNIYENRLFHFDLYRIHSPQEFTALGFEDYFLEEGICCLEWADRIESILPPHIAIELSYLGENQRSISFEEIKICAG